MATPNIVELLVRYGFLRRCEQHGDVVIDDGTPADALDVAARIPPIDRKRFASREDLELAIHDAFAHADAACVLCV